MLHGLEDRTLYRDLYNVIENSEAKLAYSYLIGWASSLYKYECFPTSHRKLREFKFVCGEKWYFSISTNKNWLSFYFRLPSQKLKKYSKKEIISKFPKARTNKLGEVRIRVATLSEAIDLAAYIDRK